MGKDDDALLILAVLFGFVGIISVAAGVLYLYRKHHKPSRIEPQSTNGDVEGSPDLTSKGGGGGGRCGGGKQLSVLVDEDEELRDVEAPLANAVNLPPHGERPTRVAPAGSDHIQLAKESSGSTRKVLPMKQNSTNEMSSASVPANAPTTQPKSNTESRRQDDTSFGEDNLEVMEKTTKMFKKKKKKKNL